MSSPVSPVQPQSPSARSRGVRGYPRRARRGGHQQQRHIQPAHIAHTEDPPPPDVAPSPRPGSNGLELQSHTAAEGSSRFRGARGGRSSRQRGRGGHVSSIEGRTFGGHLTTGLQPSNSTSSSATPLQGGAPEFKPGQHMLPRRLRRMSKSSAPDIATRIHEDIGNGLYECSICTNEILRNSKVWSCKTCWMVFHLSCIKRWSMNEGSTQYQPHTDEQGAAVSPRRWRCPGCNLPTDDLPTEYKCWCEKEVDPTGSLPHSCGQTCGKTRAPRKCPHPCDLVCHAGPCPPCPYTGPALACFCGKDVIAKRCIDTNYDSGYSCGRKCGDLMSCGEHLCDRLCHEGLCGECKVIIDDAKCYCGKVTKSIPCSERGEEKESVSPRDLVNVASPQHESPKHDGMPSRTWLGTFDCNQNCSRLFDCGKHNCSRKCHEQTELPQRCPFSPDVLTHCPCKKTLLADLECCRTSCEDPVPHCQLICGRFLICGHSCQERCHSGECLPCLQAVTISCRCGRTESSTICHQNSAEIPQCSRVCKTLLNCGRHECGERCCPGEKVAGERQSLKKKPRPLNSSLRPAVEDFEAEHICTRTCGRALKCGNPEHICQELCHRGPCGTCREATFDEITCRCGGTVLQPPLACGTKPPVCHLPCQIPHICGHPQVPHECHMENTCPKCPYLVEKVCMCGKKMLKNQPCSAMNISCGQPCGRRLKCGIHYCQKSCHRAGSCEDADSRPCPHPCGQKKTAKNCGHPCLEPCHAPYPCKEDKPCEAKVIITCECQIQKQEVKCMATKSAKEIERKSLKCNDECLRQQRNHQLKIALNISPDHLDDHIPYATTTLDLFKDNVEWSQIQEREFRVFAADSNEKRLRFKPMPPNQRAFIHALAEDFGLDSESMDPEPYRHVAVFKTPRFVSAPMKTLAQCVKIRSTAQPVTATAIPVSILPYNAMVLSSPRFALTIEELRSELQPIYASVSAAALNVAFLPSEEILLYGADNVDEATYIRLKPLVEKTVLAHSFASDVMLCRVDHSLNVIRREENASALKGGWSQVVKGAPAAKRSGDTGVGAKSAFTVLGNKAAGAKKGQKDGKDVVDDWESAVDSWN